MLFYFFLSILFTTFIDSEPILRFPQRLTLERKEEEQKNYKAPIIYKDAEIFPLMVNHLESANYHLVYEN